MLSVLQKCEQADLEQISKILESYAAFTDDKKRKDLLAQSSTSTAARKELLSLLDKQIRYYGSSDVAYVARQLFGKEPGVPSEELIKDVCDKVKVKIKMGGSVETLLERLVLSTVEKELATKSPKDLAAYFDTQGISEKEKEKEAILRKIETEGKLAALPALYAVLGEKVAMGIIQSIAISVLAAVIGKEAASALVKQLVSKLPGQALGPIIWAASAVWLAFDLQSAAFRKTIPICLYLGIVSLRDGAEDLRQQNNDSDS
ncbi:hypothetical protein LMG24076_02801 [Trinickia soli]|uniref:DUF3944 domain-containing protein n=2 Tax=Trinickia soli TaxID=380675 RepID=A0A2N7W7B9_9BURK|nr:hypothetical protein C0Z19_10085 [Trinickia soli]CAB3688423.1 hypothetical protein LMG24076_02801 [Trinickia soli]